VSKRQYILCSISHVHPYIKYVFSLLSLITKTNIYLGIASLENSRTTLNKHSVNKLIYFHVNRYIIWICQRFVKQNKVLRFPVHMKTSHQSTKKCKYKSSEKHSNTYYQNKQNINPACAYNINLINSIILFDLFIFKLCI
jgi:hypothetical protein